MAVLKYRGSDGAIKTLGINSSGGTVVSGVSSVNGKTGAVTGLYDSDNPPPYPVSSVNGKTGAVTGLYDSDNPPPYPVLSVNGKRGVVTGLYDSNNPPPYPVSSVNGKTGAVTGLYDSNNPPPYPVSSVNGKTGAVKVETGSVIRTATLTFDFSGEEGAHICRTSLVSSVDRVINIIPTINGVFNGGINYSNGYLIAGFLGVEGELYTSQLACRVIYYA